MSSSAPTLDTRSEDDAFRGNKNPSYSIKAKQRRSEAEQIKLGANTFTVFSSTPPDFSSRLSGIAAVSGAISVRGNYGDI